MPPRPLSITPSFLSVFLPSLSTLKAVTCNESLRDEHVAAKVALTAQTPLFTSGDKQQLVEAVSDDAMVGQLAVGSNRQAARAPEIARYIEECPHDRIGVEEQDHAFYVIHIRDEPASIWVAVLPDSPIFAGLRRQHAQWMTEHPGWNGWIAF